MVNILPLESMLHSLEFMSTLSLVTLLKNLVFASPTCTNSASSVVSDLPPLELGEQSIYPWLLLGDFGDQHYSGQDSMLPPFALAERGSVDFHCMLSSWPILCFFLNKSKLLIKYEHCSPMKFKYLAPFT